jgi:3-hydroxyacyl-[acyl-carrier-protein] dehydratase
MLLVDEVVNNEDGTVTGKYTVRGDEFFLQGHFPDNPIVPGVILCEMAAQSSCLLMADKVKGKLTLYAGMNNVKFKNPVRVGDTVEFICSFVKAISVFHFVKVEGYVGGKVAMKGEFSFALIDPEKAKENN